MNCTFPAKELVSEMRRVAAEADAIADPAGRRHACVFVFAINELRLAHEELAGCTCWYEAIGVPVAAGPARAYTINDAAWLRGQKVRL